MTSDNVSLIMNSIKSIPDYPKPGILFRDVTSLMEDPIAYQATIDALVAEYKDKRITKIIGTEARGFLFGAPLALALGVGFVPVRKPGKLPREVISQSYQLEYGEDTLELHVDALNADDQVLLVDDLLATGGTIEATAKLVEKIGATVVGAAFVINLPDIGGEAKLKQAGLEVFSICDFPGH